MQDTPAFAPNDRIDIEFVFPLKGLCDTREHGQQPEMTTANCMNVVPWDRSLRERGATRPGTSGLWSPPTS